ncbi:MAG: M56 family metallopeptidase [Oscillospiraceae bacterium]|nr:M56 family metallopeptidase [Oscillospiraceae bacterium]
MIGDVSWQVFFCLLVGIVLGGRTYRKKVEASCDRELGIRERYAPAFPLYWVSMFFVWFSCGMIYGVISGEYLPMIMELMPVIFCVVIYFALLLSILPLLRRWFSAGACAIVWMIPMGMLYYSTNDLDLPVFVIHIPFGVSEQVLRVVFWIWLTGFVAVLGWNIVSHIRFRRWLLKDARPITFGPVLEALRKEEQFANIQGEPYPLWISDRVRTPLSIGLFRKTICVVLPKKDYPQEDLSLIFRHELVHIGCKDSIAKFFIAFCTAMFWFFPLMWVAVRRFADDLELSCDETVLADCEDAVRRRYAALLLDTAADQRGFTTCLATSAGGLRYRLKNVMAPRKRLVGGVMVGVVTFLLMMLCFCICFSFDPGTAAERIFPDADPSRYELGGVLWEDGSSMGGDRDAVMGYLMELEVAQLSEEYSLMDQPEMIQMYIYGQEENYTLFLTQRYMRVDTFTKTGSTERCYYLSTPLDRAYLLSLMAVEERHGVDAS